jgi:hypothetical protein
MALVTQTDPVVRKDGPARLTSLHATEGGFVLNSPKFGIDTNFDVKNTVAFDMVVGGVLITVAANVSWDTGTTKAVDTDKWIAALLSIDADGTTTYLQYGAEAATEAAAIAALTALTPTGDVVVGYVAIQTKTGTTWVAGTDALQGGTGGNISNDTNYYQVFGWVL